MDPVRPAFADRADDAPGLAAPMLAQLVQCLQAESDALVAGDVDVLAQAVADKDRALQHLAAGFGRADRAALLEAVRSARDLNQRNARLLAAHMNVTRARIESLFGAARTDALYSSDGRSTVADGRLAQRGVRA